MTNAIARRSPFITIRFTLLAFLAAFAAPQLASAAPPDSAITPYVDDLTIAVVRLNVAPLDIDGDVAFAREMNKAMGLPQKDFDRSVQEARTAGGTANDWIARFNKAGGKTLYAVVAMGSPPAVRLAVPLEPGANARVLGEMLVPAKPASAPVTGPAGPTDIFDQQIMADARAEVIGKTLYVASPQVMQTLKDFTPAPRPELEAAFASCGNSPLAIAVNPNEGLRGMAVMMLPQLPKEVGGGPVTALSQGLRWATLTCDLPPKPSLRLTIQAKDAVAAAKLRDIVDKALKSFKEQFAGNVAYGAGLDKYLEALTPAVAGDQLRLDIDDQKIHFLAKGAGPALARARLEAAHIQSANNLRQIALGAVLYANAHDDKLPLNPNEDLKDYQISADLWVNPCYPDRKEGYYYIRPADKFSAIPSPADTPLFYEAFGLWQDGINVAFADGHVESIKDEAAFKKMLSKAQAKH